MKKKKYPEEKIVELLKEAEQSGESIQEFCKKKGIVEQTFYKWRKKFNGMEVKDVKKMGQLEKENARLKKLLAERDVEIDAMKELLEKKW